MPEGQPNNMIQSNLGLADAVRSCKLKPTRRFDMGEVVVYPYRLSTARFKFEKISLDFSKYKVGFTPVKLFYPPDEYERLIANCNALAHKQHQNLTVNIR